MLPRLLACKTRLSFAYYKCLRSSENFGIVLFDFEFEIFGSHTIQNVFYGLHYWSTNTAKIMIFHNLVQDVPSVYPAECLQQGDFGSMTMTHLYHGLHY